VVVKRRYELEILWENGLLTKRKITETERVLIERFGANFVKGKYEVDSEHKVRPVSFQVWDEYDESLVGSKS